MRILTNICCADLAVSKAFYVDLLGLKVNFDSDWFVHMSPPESPEIGIGLIQQNHDLVPQQYRHSPAGIYVTFVVADVDQTYAKAQQLNVPIIQEPRNEFYGQRRFLTEDPDGCLIDVCSPWQRDETS